MKLLTSIYIPFLLFQISGCFEGGRKYNFSSNSPSSRVGESGQTSSRQQDGHTTNPNDDTQNETPTPSDQREEIPRDPNCGQPQWNIDELLNRIELLKNKKNDWDEIIVEGLAGFKIIEPIFKQKCYDCHDSDRGLPWYGKPFKKHNSVYHHYIDGISALDFSTKFPLSSNGTNNQIALLNGIKNAVLDETMPLKVYTRIYPRKKIKPQDKMAVKYWVEPLVEKIEAWEQKYIYDLETTPLFTTKDCENNPTPNPPQINIEAERKKVSRIFSTKCFRCHANGVAKGKFGNMHDLIGLRNSKFIDLKTPELSELYLISESGEMPPSPRDRLNSEEVQTILEWIKAEADTIN